MESLVDEQMICSGAADALIFNTFRKYTVNMTLTNKRLLVSKVLGNDEYLLDDIVLVERFKAMFMNIGIRIHLKNGSTVSLATRHIRKFTEEFQKLGKM